MDALKDVGRYPEAAADFRHDLGNRLIRRWSTIADVERIANFAGMIWRSAADAPPNPRVVSALRWQMRGDFPFMAPGDCALVEDSSRPGSPIVACACLWRRVWEYEGIPFVVGQIETVATDPDYRHRGLAGTLMAMMHARSAAEGHHAQIINGIACFYRQFGYEYALEFGGRRVTHVSLLPQSDKNVGSLCTLRPATLGDIPQIMEWANRRRETGVIWYPVPERYWHSLITSSDEHEAPTNPAVGDAGERLLMMVDTTGLARGFVLVPTRRSSTDLAVHALEAAPDASLPDLALALLQALRAYGEQLLAIDRAVPPPLSDLIFYLGSAHPLYDVLGRELAHLYDPPYAWYIRVPDLAAFMRHITPALERRLADSAAAGYTGHLTLDFYRGGICLRFAAGKLDQIDSWSVPPQNGGAYSSFPELVFLQLLFGYRSLAELRHAFPDVTASERSQLLLDALFPARQSWTMLL